jgi:protein TonB
MGGNVVQGRLVKSVPPQFPDVARQRHVEGDVVVRADVDASGNVAAVTALSGPELLRSAALASVHQSKYAPALLNGQPVPMQVQVTVKFRSTK